MTLSMNVCHGLMCLVTFGPSKGEDSADDNTTEVKIDPQAHCVRPCWGIIDVSFGC